MELADYLKKLIENIEKSGQIPTKTTVFLDAEGKVVSTTIEYS